MKHNLNLEDKMSRAEGIASSIKTESDSISQTNESAREIAKKTAEEVAKKVVNEVWEKRIPKITETLGIFVALFTFVSIEIQIFSKVTQLSSAIIFAFIIFLCMIGFIFMLHFILFFEGGIKKFFNSISIRGLIAIIVFIFLLIILLIKFDTPISKQQDQEIEDIKKQLIKHESDIENLKNNSFFLISR